MNPFALLVISLFIASSTCAQLKTFKVFAHDTDNKIKPDTTCRGFPCDSLFHYVYINPDKQSRNRLLLFLPGTNASPEMYQRIDSLAANLGYHVIGLNYINEVSISTLCSNTPDENCSENARKEIIYGTDLHNSIQIDAANSVVNRLLKLLTYLNSKHPAGEWARFLDSDHTGIQWDKIAVAGHSQGGGHAALLAQDYDVDRVLFFNSPSDKNNFYNDQPPWFYRSNVSDDSKYYAFYHEQNGGPNRLEVYKNFGMNKYGPQVNVDIMPPPYSFSHILMTDNNTFPMEDYTNTNCFGGEETAVDPHNDIIVDCEVPVDMDNHTPYEAAWIHMLTNETSNIVTGGGNPSEDHSLQYYPNPTLGSVYIGLNQDEALLTITDMGGSIHEIQMRGKFMDLSEFRPGVYVLTIQWRNGSKTQERITKL